VVRSTDGGATWGSAVRVGSSITDSSDNDNAPIGLAIKGATQLVTGPDSTPEYGVYIATTTGGSFSALGSTPRDDTPFPLIKIADSSIAYASVPNTTPLAGSGYTTDFDGGYDSYTLIVFSGDTGTDTGTGFSGNCAETVEASGDGITGISINFTLVDVSSPTVETVEYRFWFDHDSIEDANHDIDPVLRIYTPSGQVSTATSQTGRQTWYNVLFRPESGEQTPVNESVENTIIRETPFLPASSYDSIEVGLVPFSAIFAEDTMTMRIDDIQINGGAVSGHTIAYQFQRINTYAATPAWSDKSPAANQAPIQPHAASIDRIDPDTIHIYADDGKWYSSSDNGDNWTTEESSSDKRTFDSAGDIIIVGTATGLSVSTDGGTSFDDKDGNLAVADENFDTTKQVLVI
jgi:hypothetical protein